MEEFLILDLNGFTSAAPQKIKTYSIQVGNLREIFPLVLELFKEQNVLHSKITRPPQWYDHSWKIKYRVTKECKVSFIVKELVSYLDTINKYHS